MKKDKMAKVMGEYKRGTLHAGKNPKGPKKAPQGQEPQAGDCHCDERGREGQKEMSDFPTIVYRAPGPYRGPKGATYDYKGVADQAAFDAALANGWHETLPKALGAHHLIAAADALEEAIDDVSPATRNELEQKAKALGVSFNARTRDDVLIQRIAEAS